VVFFVHIGPAPTRRQLERWLDAYEAARREKAGNPDPGSTAPGS
jgi:hypothetical protein